MNQLHSHWAEFAFEWVHFRPNIIELDKGEDYQGEFWMEWDIKTGFTVYLLTKRYLTTVKATLTQPPEHIFNEQEHKLTTRKIREVIRWVESFGFEL